MPRIRSDSRKKTGSLSRIAVLSNPLASYGVDGIAIFRPGTEANIDSTAHECVEPSCPPAPLLPRNTIGQENCPPDMYSIFGALFRIWSAATRQKDHDMNSMIGRRPYIAAPTPSPEKAVSEIGVSMIRLSPNSASIPLETLYAPLYCATSSPMRNTFWSRRISSSMASRRASRYSIGRAVVETITHSF